MSIRIVFLSVLAALSSSVAKAESIPCGLQGTLEERAAHCRTLLGEKALRNHFRITREMADNPLTDLDASIEVRWALIAQDEENVQLWMNGLTGELWTAYPAAWNIAVQGADSLDHACTGIAIARLRLRDVAFSIPSADQWTKAVEQGALTAMTYARESAFARGEDGQLAESDDADAMSLVCRSNQPFTLTKVAPKIRRR